jgi:hypothetical protein
MSRVRKLSEDNNHPSLSTCAAQALSLLYLAELEVKGVVQQLLIVDGLLGHQSVANRERLYWVRLESFGDLGCVEDYPLRPLSENVFVHGEAPFVRQLYEILLVEVVVFLNCRVVDEPALIAEQCALLFET